MPGFSISVNGQLLATISTEDLNVVAVQVHGDCIGMEMASVEASGGRYGEEEDNKHLIWLDDRQIKEGDEVEVVFLEKVETNPVGKTIEELYPDENNQPEPLQSLEKVFQDLAKKPRVRDRFVFNLVTPLGEVIDSSTETNDHSFSFSVLWNWMHPDTVRASLTSNSLEGIEKKSGGVDHARFRMEFGQSVKLRVSA